MACLVSHGQDTWPQGGRKGDEHMAGVDVEVVGYGFAFVNLVQ